MYVQPAPPLCLEPGRHVPGGLEVLLGHARQLVHGVTQALCGARAVHVFRGHAVARAYVRGDVAPPLRAVRVRAPQQVGDAHRLAQVRGGVVRLRVAHPRQVQEEEEQRGGGGVGVGLQRGDARGRRGHLRVFDTRLHDLLQPALGARAGAAHGGGQRHRHGVLGHIGARVDGADGLAPPLQPHQRQLRLLGGAQRLRRLHVERAHRQRGGAVLLRERERAQIVLVVELPHARAAVTKRALQVMPAASASSFSFSSAAASTAAGLRTRRRAGRRRRR
mmetsp:Transcript_33084/g.81364  ORF Transcript_33084/g.81364 Transcript_33084/m.81364 type:complete len:277 (+) Transcript_33084:76-906(+)